MHSRKVSHFNAQYFDHYAGGGPYGRHPYNEALFALIRKYKSNGKLLEIGCAFGFFLQLAEAAFETYGVDISEHAISQARQNTLHSVLQVGYFPDDTLVRNFKKHKFDIIIALDVLEHLPNPKEALSTIYELIADDGLFVFKVPNLLCLQRFLYQLVGKKEYCCVFSDKTHISLYYLKKWMALLGSVGFRCKIMPTIPFRFLKNFVVRKNLQHLFFMNFPPLHFLNPDITFLCEKP